MTWYTGYYGRWTDGTFTRLTSTYNKKDIFAEAKETANRTGETVYIIGEVPYSPKTYDKHYEIKPETH